MAERKGRAQLLAADPATLTEWEQAWREYFEANPTSVAVWGHQNGRWPMGHPYRDDSELGI